MPSASSNAPVALPLLIAAFVEATNSFDLQGQMVTFADDTLVNDQLGRNGHQGLRRTGHPRRKWMIVVAHVVKHYDNFIVTGDIDGNFDGYGLAAPLVLAFYFAPHNDLIIQLIILRNRRDI